MPPPLFPVPAFRPRLASEERLDVVDPNGDVEPPASGRLPLDPFEPVLATPRIAARRQRTLVFMDPSEVWAFEADARLTFAHSAQGKLDIDVSLAEIEGSPLGTAFVRVHRSWLANLALVRSLEHTPGETQLFVGASLGAGFGIHVPVSRDRVRAVRAILLESTIGVRRRESSEDTRSF
jgi:DNA-binding LytR/AlgR family response regulator